MAFTDIDASLSLGLSLKGAKWARPDDVIGIGGAINARRGIIAISSRQAGSHSDRTASSTPARANPQTYYAYALNKQLTLTADYQLITNPANNADRDRSHLLRAAARRILNLRRPGQMSQRVGAKRAR